MKQRRKPGGARLLAAACAAVLFCSSSFAEGILTDEEGLSLIREETQQTEEEAQLLSDGASEEEAQLLSDELMKEEEGFISDALAEPEEQEAEEDGLEEAIPEEPEGMAEDPDAAGIENQKPDEDEVFEDLEEDVMQEWPVFWEEEKTEEFLPEEMETEALLEEEAAVQEAASDTGVDDVYRAAFLLDKNRFLLEQDLPEASPSRALYSVGKREGLICSSVIWEKFLEDAAAAGVPGVQGMTRQTLGTAMILSLLEKQDVLDRSGRINTPLLPDGMKANEGMTWLECALLDIRMLQEIGKLCEDSVLKAASAEGLRMLDAGMNAMQEMEAMQQDYKDPMGLFWNAVYEAAGGMDPSMAFCWQSYRDGTLLCSREGGGSLAEYTLMLELISKYEEAAAAKGRQVKTSFLQSQAESDAALWLGMADHLFECLYLDCDLAIGFAALQENATMQILLRQQSRSAAELTAQVRTMREDASVLQQSLYVNTAADLEIDAPAVDHGEPLKEASERG